METISLDEFKKRYGDAAAASFDTPAPTKPTEAPLSERLAAIGRNAVSTAHDAIASEGDFAGQTALRRGTGAAAAIAGIVPAAANETLPKPVRDAEHAVGEAVKPAFKSVTDALASIPGLSDLVLSHPKVTKAIEEALGTAANVGEVAGDILAVEGGKAVGQSAGAGVKNAAHAVADGSESALSAITKSPKTLKDVRMALTELDPQAETILKQTNLDEFEDYFKAASKAAVDPRQPTPLELAGKRAEDSLDQIQRKMQGIGADKRTVLSKAAIGLKPVGNIALKFRQELGNAIKDGVAVKGDASLMDGIMAKAQELGANPSAAQVDRFIDSAQDLLYTASRDLTVPVTTAGVARVRSLLGKLNESLKSNLPDSYRNVNKQYHDLVDVRNELNTKLGKEGERAGALMKRVFSPSDANTKELFERVRKETGIDLVKEATLARFVMESVGDVRQKSLLKQLDMATKDLSQLDLTKPGTWLQFLRDRAELPADEAAREVIRKSTSGE